MSNTTRAGQPRQRRAGGGRKPKGSAPMKHNIGTRVSAEDAATIRAYPPQSELFRLVASGLRLGKDNLPDLTAEEHAALRVTLKGRAVDALFLRHLADEVAEAEHPAAASLAGKLRPLGDWERLALVLATSIANPPRRPKGELQ